METTRHSKIWWGEFELDENRPARWEIGPLTLWLERTETLWRVAYDREADALTERASIELAAGNDVLPPEDVVWRRFGMRRTSPAIRLTPRLADRPVVARSEAPFTVPPNERVELFVSTPLWLRLDVGTGDGPLYELPIWRPSDTWFGNNQTGFLGYATRTTLRHRLDEIPIRPHRAVTPFAVENLTDEPLTLERVSIPVTSLSLFADPDGGVWTEQLGLVREAPDEMARVDVSRGAPPQVSNANPIAGPREAAAGSFASRVFTGLFS